MIPLLLSFKDYTRCFTCNMIVIFYYFASGDLEILNMYQFNTKHKKIGNKTMFNEYFKQSMPELSFCIIEDYMSNISSNNAKVFKICAN